jgi:hypothetical protein
MLKRSLAAIMFALLLAVPALAQDDSKPPHAGYYYPPGGTEEIFESKVSQLAGVNRKSRIGLVSGLTKRQLDRQYDPGYIMLAKGADAEKMIIVATQDGRFDTIYRLRALIAGLDAEARFSPLFQSSGASEFLTFLDLLKLGGFTQITISNGRDLTHTIYVR